MTAITTKSGVKEYVSSQELAVGGDVYEKLESVAQEVLDKAISRAKANSRKTLQGKDL